MEVRGLEVGRFGSMEEAQIFIRWDVRKYKNPETGHPTPSLFPTLLLKRLKNMDVTF